MTHPDNIFAEFIWNLGFAICHQNPERSFFIGGYQLPVCARDTGTLIGFFAVFTMGLLLKRYRNSGIPDKPVIALSLFGFVLFAVDGASSYLGFRETTNTIRLVTGLMMGAAIGFFAVLIVSFVLLGNRNSIPAFTWKDLPLAYLPLIAVGTCILYFDNVIFLYYAFSMLIVAGYFILTFVIFSALISLMLDWNWRESKNRTRLISGAIVLQGIVIAAMWSLHAVTGGLPL